MLFTFWNLIYFVLIISYQIHANQFGFITYTSDNIGDDFQSIAAKRFLPKNSIGIHRDSIGEFEYPAKVKTIVNGFFMLNTKSWPPSDCIEPLLISLHFPVFFFPKVFSTESIEYLKRNGPIGARDTFTLKQLEKRGIPCFYSSCLTLTLENTSNKREDVIYAVDLPDNCVEYIKSKTKSDVRILTHKIPKYLSQDDRIKYAEEILEKYKTAKCVITSRFHATMPCLALETPVLLINTQWDQYRFEGLKELVSNGSKMEFLCGDIDYDFDNPPKNSNKYIPLRENLIKIVTEWVNKNSF